MGHSGEWMNTEIEVGGEQEAHRFPLQLGSSKWLIYKVVKCTL